MISVMFLEAKIHPGWEALEYLPVISFNKKLFREPTLHAGAAGADVRIQLPVIKLFRASSRLPDSPALRRIIYLPVMKTFRGAGSSSTLPGVDAN